MTKQLIKTTYDTEDTKLYYYVDGTITFKGTDGMEYTYRSLKDMFTYHNNKPNRRTKVDKGVSISTYKGFNDNCKVYAKNENYICSKCYVDKCKFPTLVNKLKENTYNLTKRALTDAEIQDAVDTLGRKRKIKFFRFEAFGDVINALQVENYLRLSQAIDEQLYLPQALFTKRPYLWYDGFKKYGKPDTLKAVYSVPLINGLDAVMPMFVQLYFDKIFIVVTPEYERENGVIVTCGGRDCKGCMRCYRDTPEAYVIERLK